MSFYFAVAYIIIEYMRPQSTYEALSGLPIAQIAILGCMAFFLLEGREKYNYNSQSIVLLIYLFWFFISHLFAFDQNLAWDAWIDFSKWVLIYFLLINTINDRRRLYIFVVFFLLVNFKYAQFAVRLWVSEGFYTDPRGFNAGGGFGAGFFKNPNDFAVAMNSVLGLSYFMIQSDLNKIVGWFKMRWFHLVCATSIAIAVLASSSRGGALGLGIIALGLWYKSKRKTLGVGALIIVTMLAVALIPEDNWNRFQMMGSEEDHSSQSRMELWRVGIRMANEYPLTGVGPNNFIYVNTRVYLSELREVQHNVFIQALSELGYPGLFLFLAMILFCFRNHKRVREVLQKKSINDPFLEGLSHGLDICLLGFVANGFFITVLYYPFFWMLLVLGVALLDTVNRLEPSREHQIAQQSVPILQR